MKTCAKHPELGNYSQKRCPACNRENIAAWIKKNPAAFKETRKKWASNNKDKLKKAQDAWKKANPERYKEIRRNWRTANPEKHKAIRKSKKAVYSQTVRLARPKWANRVAIISIYRNCPEGHHVDHIVPLRGIDPITGEHNVCGLHVENNLGYLPAADNESKWAWHTP